jgi:Domain of unknown function (DUF1906)
MRIGIMTMAFVVSMTTAIAFSGASTSSASTPPPPVPCCGGGNPVWGWDTYGGSGGSGALTPTTLAALITELKGTPGVIGVYLDHGTGPVLTSGVVSTIHGHGIVMNLIEDSYTAAEVTSGGLETAAEGSADATTAATNAHNLGAPENSSIVIYRDIENGENVSWQYITAYYNELSGHHFIPGFYENPISGQFNGAFCNTTSTIENGSAQWTDEPSTGASTLSQFYYTNRPAWTSPDTTTCTPSGASVYAWQYILAGGVGPVDDDLMSTSGTW